MKKLFYIFTLLVSVAAFGQQYKLKKAEKLFDEMAYAEAAEAYEDYLGNENKPDAKVLLRIAESYYYTGQTAEALKWYEGWAATHPSGPVTLADWHYAQVKRIETGSDIGIFVYYKFDEDKSERLINQKQYLDSINAQPSQYTITNLPSNTRLADFGTAFYGGKIVYASAKDTVTGGHIHKRNNQPFLNLYIAERHPEDGTLFGETAFFPKSQITWHNATPAFVNSSSLYFSANIVKGNGNLNSNDKGTANVRLLKGTMNGDRLETQDLPFNSKNYSVAQPAVTADGKWLYFVSDMPGGYGETDIYKVEIKANGSYGKPQNLGPEVNTPHREMFPFVQNDILYFASDGHYGLGGLDVFKSEITADAFTLPQNVGKPVNSNLDDFAFIITGNGDYGYFSSNRAGGKGDDDIYYFTKIKPCEETVAGIVLHKKTGLPLKGLRVSAKDVEDGEIASAETDAEGFYQLKLPCGAIVIIEINEGDSVPDKKEITVTPGVKVDFEITKYDDLVTKDTGIEKITINTIFFEFDKWDITPQAAAELDKVVYAMQSFPDIIIKIESHTDSRGSDEYNMVLSVNRAKATHEYILSKGMAANRIESVNGYGETQLVNNCSNGATCSNEEHLRNRRSEFIIVKK